MAHSTAAENGGAALVWLVVRPARVRAEVPLRHVEQRHDVRELQLPA
jgi:hypothetical protein